MLKTGRCFQVSGRKPSNLRLPSMELQEGRGGSSKGVGEGREGKGEGGSSSSRSRSRMN
jgi:hypothetical protein